MIVRSDMFRPVGGSFYGHLFENTVAGVPLGIYWNFCIDLEPLVDADGDEWESNLQFEWLSWPVRDWRKLSGCSLDSSATLVTPEASLYAFSQHQIPNNAGFLLSHLSDATFGIESKVLIDLEDLDGDISASIEIGIQTQLAFEGLIVVSQNLPSGPRDADSVSRALANFVDLAAYETPIDDEERWRIRPKVS
jgi:hypothetical protein